ncbi:uncharacterized protein LACBIDRAFT_301528 [Laccaria bicolor S238N-H82]|uniref:Predicted protein n=1 Tax=Laccaria bicolor (strain S238N-H82 / ATCC MYA-4686) TaxID=486041 RepID=B0CNR3_LACBS|nr:uncharacterized protein LACBIDRAFT_301528 [Laccaria bicolor S238N-H82]EDR15344.1 predicted protein [Laccaria bicolor S238N-H82]|eukprot:XP_001873552.1 predicted protein [Laccaria bicolor S238N-H82]
MIENSSTTTLQETVAIIPEQTQPSRKRKQSNLFPTLVTGKVPTTIGPDGYPLRKSDCHGFSNPCGLRVRVHLGKGMGLIFPTLTKPVPVAGVSGYP